MMIKNIVFDIGNVIVKWDPLLIVKRAFPDHSDPDSLKNQLFKSDIWSELNLGKMSEEEAILEYQKTLDIEVSALVSLMLTIKRSLDPIPGSQEIVRELTRKGFTLYALTNNTNDIMDYLNNEYGLNGWFQGVVCSSQVGYRKPSPDIFRFMLKTYAIVAQETLFIDDHAPNLRAAEEFGIRTLQFVDAQQCAVDLRSMQIDI